MNSWKLNLFIAKMHSTVINNSLISHHFFFMFSIQENWCLKFGFWIFQSVKWNGWDSLTVIQYWLLCLQWYLLVLNYTGIIQKTTFHSCKEKADFDKKSAYHQPGKNIYIELNDSMTQIVSPESNWPFGKLSPFTMLLKISKEIWRKEVGNACCLLSKPKI